MAENELPEPESVKLFEGMTGGDSDSIPTYDVVIKIRRYNPEVSSEAYWDEFPLTMYRTDRVLDALHKIKWEVDGSVSFRRSCAHGICGSDAMRINGRNRLACKTLLKDLDLSKPITVEPIKGLPCEKDLIVDMEPFFQASCRSSSTTRTSLSVSACRPLRTVHVSMTPPSASSVQHVPRPARSSGPTVSTSAPPLL